MEVQYGVLALYWEAVQWPLALVTAMQRSEFLDDWNGVALEVFNGWSYVQNSFSG